MARVVNLTRGTELGSRVEEAGSFFARALGLMFRSSLPEGGGLVLRPCTSIHMFCMRMPLDVVFLDDDDVVVALYPGIKPWRVSGLHWSAAAAVELPVGVIERTATVVGDRVAIEAGQGA